ncbi:mannitol dehydrogenase family protein [Sphingomonas bacterium]|uniref:mannitol dehydrogenase family protein n=1 Tax=Sphingomonas bacterium TaxID=1895847 RepID=UPI001575DAA7|nr:mannitol dehydrogenase family protein [Sphingomonas bacterium]
MIRLNRSSLTEIPNSICQPAYDPRAVSAGIVHIGLGGFHRAHMARYVHDLMTVDPDATRWGIVGSGLRQSDSRLLERLAAQDHLYTLIERDAAGEASTIIGSLCGVIDASTSASKLLDALTARATKIVSVTVSERGYGLNPATKKIDADLPEIRQDLETPQAPRSVPGLLAEALRRRRAAGLSPFTALCCDNIQHNGRVLREAVMTLAAATDARLGAWIETYGAFPNAMVDRITPVPTPADIQAVNMATGIADEAALVAERFRQWVLEDASVAEQPAWERVGVQIVSDVTPYETMKLRLLNASHLAIASLGALDGHVTVLDAIGDKSIRSYMMRLMDEETGPTVPPVPGIDLTVYKRTLVARFGNPAVRDTLERINRDAPLNLLLDPLRDRLTLGAPIELLALALAAWCSRVRLDARLAAEKKDIAGSVELMRRAAAAHDNLDAVLGFYPAFGDVGRNVRLVGATNQWFKRLNTYGVREVLREVASEDCA